MRGIPPKRSIYSTSSALAGDSPHEVDLIDLFGAFAGDSPSCAAPAALPHDPDHLHDGAAVAAQLHLPAPKLR
ncbi:hypothetical protein J2Z45_004256 [Cohnella lubricantis]|nr:hypothetical protein [Cohnella lubricantis]